jgi:hypothetical protein
MKYPPENVHSFPFTPHHTALSRGGRQMKTASNRSAGKVVFLLPWLVLIGVAYAEQTEKPDPRIADEAAAAAELDQLYPAPNRILVIRERSDPDHPEDKIVTSVNFCGNPVEEKAAVLVSRLFRLTTLNLADSKIADDQMKHLSKLEKLCSLILSKTPITDAGLAHLRPLKNLESLMLENTAITDRGMEHLAALDNLKILQLSKTKVADAGMKHLLPLGNLKWLLLQETDLTDAGLDTLSGMKNLGRLTATRTKVTPEGIAKFKQACPRTQVDHEEPKS